MPELPPEGESFRTVLVCEMLSTSNARYDQQTKAPFYASIDVPWLWTVDTRSRLIETRRLHSGSASIAVPQAGGLQETSHS
jgi:Uma2 family endonuclease